MRLTLGQLAPAPADPARNLERIDAAMRAAPADLAIFPELFLSGYRVGDRIHGLALTADGSDPTSGGLRRIAKEQGTPLVVGAPVGSADRRGEVHNAAIVAHPSGALAYQVKRYLPNFGPFEEALAFSPTDTSRPIDVAGHSVGVEICYDVFFPEVARDLALAGASLLINISASPVTSRSLFERLLPARAIENGMPVVYVNRVGVEDGFVFGGGSGAWDPRGDPLPLEPVALPGLAREESVFRVEVDPGSVGRWRPFRPVLRDLAARPASSSVR
ncbi:MAG: carbon-nitrogen hydrolase family protein [Thermoplasmata archaeon]